MQIRYEKVDVVFTNSFTPFQETNKKICDEMNQNDYNSTSLRKENPGRRNKVWEISIIMIFMQQEIATQNMPQIKYWIFWRTI